MTDDAVVAGQHVTVTLEMKVIRADGTVETFENEIEGEVVEEPDGDSGS